MPESQGGPRAMSGLISMGGKFVASMNLAGTAITGLINGIIKVGRIAGKFETVRISLKFLTGSAKSARIALSQMMDFANKSPFDHDEVIEAGRILLKYGQDAGSVSKTLSMLGEVAAGSGSSLGTIADIYGRMMKDGKAGVNELNELTASGVPIIEQLAKQYGKTNTEIL